MNNLVGATLLNRYHIESFVGRGGMAEVYRVWDARRATYLAMKLLREDLAQDRVFLRRFRREAETLARLQHPHIVRFYGLEQDGLLAFMLMDFVEGTSLRTEIFQSEGAPLSEQRIREVIRPICSALHYAHSQGMIHCDIKPGNILIDQTGRVLVSDFGIARMTDGATATMVGMGTPAYMAPEQVLGQAPLPQADIYAVGVVLYEMLTGGERPFTGERAQKTGSTSEKIHWEQLNLKPPSLCRYNTAISAELEAVVLGCLAKEPEQRYAAPLDLLNALDGAMGEVEIAASPPDAEARPSTRREARVTDDVRIKPEHRMEAARVRPGTRSTRRKGIPTWLWMGGIVVVISAMIGGAVLSKVSNGDVWQVERAVVVKSTATNSPTPTPTATNSPAPTPTATNSRTPEPMATNTPTLVPTLTAGEQAHMLAEAGVTYNDAWTPYTEEINDVPMALVPVGCFEMGSEAGFWDERPVHTVCFDKPFWIDVYEVTNAQFASLGGQAGRNSYRMEDERPREQITWGEANTFCKGHGSRLPTEAEWEYAARGPDGLVYPWGNRFIADNVVYKINSGGITWNVGSKPGGVSWIGAYDLSGNVWEWVNDWYGTYPSEQQLNPMGPSSGGYRVLRGGGALQLPGDNYYDINARGSNRTWYSPGNWGYDYGFRCARSY